MLTTALSSLLLLVVAQTAWAGFPPAFCQVSDLMVCKGGVIPSGKCKPGFYHGIDSLEAFQMTRINNTALRLHALNGTFQDTIVHVSWAPSNSSYTGPFDPKYCVKAPPAPTGEGNCSTTLTSFFSDVNKELTTNKMESCGIIEWFSELGPYGAWVHANEPHRVPASEMCAFDAAKEVYHEVGTYGVEARYFTIGTINASAAHVHSLNASFPDTVASLFAVSGKIAWRATLFGGKEYHGIMRPQGPAGSLNCCEVHGNTYKRCPELEWWNAETGDRSCWETTIKPAAPEGSCTER